jgi:hypothetical protein
MTQVMHVWGPSSSAQQTSIPIRTAADREANTTRGTNPSAQVINIIIRVNNKLQ